MSYEERLAAVEVDLRQFKTDTVKAYGNLAHEVGIVRGLIETDIGRMATLSATMERRFERVDIHLDGMDAHLEHMDKRIDRLETTLGEHTTRLDRLETTLGEHTSLLTQILARLPGKP